jgi:hypothetical protein
MLLIAKLATFGAVAFFITVSGNFAGDKVDVVHTSLDNKYEPIPVTLDTWKIEYHQKGEGSTSISLRADGILSGHATRGMPQTFMARLPQNEVAGVFNATRHLVNSTRVRTPTFSDDDVMYIVAVEVEGGNRIEIKMHSEQEYEADFAAAVNILNEYSPKPIETFDRYLGEKQSRTRREKEVSSLEGPAVGTIWIAGVQPDNPTTLGLDASCLQLTIAKVITEIPLAPEDTHFQQIVCRKVMSQYRLRNVAGDEKTHMPIPFTIGVYGNIHIVLSCNVQMLNEMGVLEDFNAYAASVSHRLEAVGSRKRAVMPWQQ